MKRTIHLTNEKLKTQFNIDLKGKVIQAPHWFVDDVNSEVKTKLAGRNLILSQNEVLISGIIFQKNDALYRDGLGTYSSYCNDCILLFDRQFLGTTIDVIYYPAYSNNITLETINGNLISRFSHHIRNYETFTSASQPTKLNTSGKLDKSEIKFSYDETINPKHNKKQCTCSGHTLLWHGCKCGGK